MTTKTAGRSRKRLHGARPLETFDAGPTLQPTMSALGICRKSPIRTSTTMKATPRLQGLDSKRRNNRAVARLSVFRPVFEVRAANLGNPFSRLDCFVFRPLEAA